MNRHFAHGLAVHLDTGFLKACNKAAISHPEGAASRIDTDDPQLAHGRLLFATVAVCELAGALKGAFGIAVQPRFIPEETSSEF